MIRSRVIGTGRFLPEKVLTNIDLEELVDTTDEWIQKRTGILQRHSADKNTGPSTLGAGAALRALESAKICPEEIDLIVCCTSTPDYLFPSTACLVQAKIGATNAAAYDINAACSGFIYGLATIDAFIRSEMYKTALLIGVDVLLTKLNWERRDTAVLFGDGAGAVVLQAQEGENGVLFTELGSDGTAGDLLIMPSGDSRSAVSTGEPEDTTTNMVMDGQGLFKKAVVRFANASADAIEAAGLHPDDIDLFVPHQANTRIIFSAAKRIKFPQDRIFVNIDHVANTVAATIPIALDEAIEQGRIKEDSYVLLAAFGAGLTWASAILRW